MPSFPRLTTGHVAQYPASYTTRHETAVISYLDGSEQRYPRVASGLRRWRISLRGLSPSQAAQLRTFLKQQQGRTGVFSFTDPWTGREYPACALDSDIVRVLYAEEWDARMTITIREVRG